MIFLQELNSFLFLLHQKIYGILLNLLVPFLFFVDVFFKESIWIHSNLLIILGLWLKSVNLVCIFK